MAHGNGERLHAAGVRVFITLPTGLRGELISALPVERTGKQFEITIGDMPANDEISLVFAITTGRSQVGAAVPVAIRCEWTEPGNGVPQSLPVSVDPLLAAPAGSSLLQQTDPEVAEQAALQQAAREQREAMRLDREGRYADSRRLHQQAAAFLAAAPPTGRVEERLREARAYASYDVASAMPESVRKQAVHANFRRGRGRADEQ